MRRIDHPLVGSSLGQTSTLTSLHFGAAGARPKAYLQASLHAGELPGILVYRAGPVELLRVGDLGNIAGAVAYRTGNLLGA